MVFVFSAWWFVLLALVLVVVGLTVWLVMLNKQDRKIVEEFKLQAGATETKLEETTKENSTAKVNKE